MARKRPQISWGDDALKTVMAILRNAEKRGKTEKAVRVGGRIEKQFKKQRPKVETKALSKKIGQMEDELRYPKVQAKRAQDAKILREQERTLRATRLGDAAAEKGTKRKGDKEIPMSKKKAEEAALQGRRAGAQRAKGNATKKAFQDSLRKQIANTKDATKRRQLRQKLYKHEDKYGKFS